jgi:hypothetical protein
MLPEKTMHRIISFRENLRDKRQLLQPGNLWEDCTENEDAMRGKDE